MASGKAISVALTVAVALLAAAAPARAAPFIVAGDVLGGIFYFDNSTLGGATIEFEADVYRAQNSGTNLKIAVIQESGITSKFIQTGNHLAFAFNLATGVTFSNLSVFAPSNYSPAPGSVSASGEGTFSGGLNCTSCGATSGTQEIDFSLSVAGNGGSAFNSFAKNSSGYYFAADMNYNLSGSTGNIFSTTAKKVPEPASMALLGAGVLGLAALRRRRRA